MTFRIRAAAPAALAAIALGACAPAASRDAAADTTAPVTTGAAGATAAAIAPGSGGDTATGAWVTLFDGGGLERWRGYKRETPPGAWTVEGKTLAVRPVADTAQHGDLLTRDQYGDFEFAYEWRVSPGANSGVIYRADNAHDFVWQTGPEMQVLDNGRHPDGRNPLTSAGADYAVYPPSADVTRPVGEWNAARIVARGAHVEHWLNDRKVVEYEQGSDDWKRRVAASKFKTWPEYGTLRRGYIALQYHGDSVWYRNVRVRTLGG